jgi:hypothetical protein
MIIVGEHIRYRTTKLETITIAHEMKTEKPQQHRIHQTARQ